MQGRRALLLLTTIAALSGAPASAAAQSDAAATQAYLQADFRLVQRAGTHISVGESAIQGVLAGVRTSCPLAGGGSPQDSESTGMSNEVIGAMVTGAIHTDLASIRRFIAATASLHWSNGGLTRTVAAYVRKLRTMASLVQPPLCSDVRTWAASAFHAVPLAAVAFQERFISNWVALGELPAALARYESGEGHSLARRAEHYESQLTEFEARAVETYSRIMNDLELLP
jgi:hypothetical protein